MPSSTSPVIEPFFHAQSNTIAYVVSCPQTNQAAVIDSPLDFDLPSGQITTTCTDNIISYLEQNSLTVCWLLETHAHADHLSSAQYLKQQCGGQTAIGQDICFAQQTFKAALALPTGMATDGRQFDRLLIEGDTLKLGNLTIKTLSTPGHTNDSMSYVIEDNVFVGDTLFMPDSGTARCDFPGGDAGVLFDSIQKIFALGNQTNIWICHDYQPHGRPVACKTTVAAQQAQNVHLKDETSRADFVELRQSRDAKLKVPKLLYPAVQVNICAGGLPPAEDNKQSYVKIPLTCAKHF
jgi:glyoxylase-like metal-dependent hydrolase (beta-lactamase superfamily II)